MKHIMFLLVVGAILITSCAPQQPQTIVVQAPPQQQQQSQTVIVEQPQSQIVVPEVVPVPVPDRLCGWLRESYLSPGMIVHVSTHPNLRNNIRRGPSAYSEYMGQIQVGRSVRLLDGPYCADGGEYIFWHVEVLDRDAIYDRQYPKSQYRSVYTAETDTTGLPWLEP